MPTSLKTAAALEDFQGHTSEARLITQGIVTSIKIIVVVEPHSEVVNEVEDLGTGLPTTTNSITSRVRKSKDLISRGLIADILTETIRILIKGLTRSTRTVMLRIGMEVGLNSIMAGQGNTYVSIKVNPFAAEAIDMDMEATVEEEVVVVTEGICADPRGAAEPCSNICTTITVT